MQAYQIPIVEEPSSPPVSCAFTGHRDLEKDFSRIKLKKLLKQLIESGIKIFYNGLARGFDLAACEVLFLLKRKYKDIRVIGCIPYEQTEQRNRGAEGKRYQNILRQLDETVCVSQTPYYNGCMQKRNRYMCDRADVIVAYCKKDTGGTAYTVQYFQKQYPQKKVYFL